MEVEKNHFVFKNQRMCVDEYNNLNLQDQLEVQCKKHLLMQVALNYHKNTFQF